MLPSIAQPRDRLLLAPNSISTSVHLTCNLKTGTFKHLKHIFTSIINDSGFCDGLLKSSYIIYKHSVSTWTLLPCLHTELYIDVSLPAETLYFFGDNNFTEWQSLFEQYESPPYVLPRTSGAYSFGIAGSFYSNEITPNAAECQRVACQSYAGCDVERLNTCMQSSTKIINDKSFSLFWSSEDLYKYCFSASFFFSTQRNCHHVLHEGILFHFN